MSMAKCTETMLTAGLSTNEASGLLCPTLCCILPGTLRHIPSTCQSLHGCYNALCRKVCMLILITPSMCLCRSTASYIVHVNCLKHRAFGTLSAFIIINIMAQNFVNLVKITPM